MQLLYMQFLHGQGEDRDKIINILCKEENL